MRKSLLVLVLFLCSCVGIRAPYEFDYKEVEVDGFTIASWQKITDKTKGYKVYIEGDGASFNAHGMPTNDPTPRGKLLREIAFGDENVNVIYLARPCQFIIGGMCSQRHWTTARFASEVIRAQGDAIASIVGKNEVILVGFSGGAQVAGLVASLRKDLNIKKVITIAGNLDHLAWTTYHKLPSLNESLNLSDYKDVFFEFEQMHFVGSQDDVIVPNLVYDFVKKAKSGKIEVVEVEEATHNLGWESIYDTVRRQ